MKKLAVFIFLIILVLMLSLFQTGEIIDFDYGQNYTYTLYLNDKNFNYKGYETIQNGQQLIVKTSSHRAKLLNSLDLNIGAESLIFNATNSIQLVNKITQELNLKILSTEQIDNVFVINAYSNKLAKYIFKNHNKFNIQIAITSNAVVVGYPLILHGY